MTRRLDELGRLADTLPPDIPAVWLLYDDLVHDPEPKLAALTAFLELDHPLSPEYRVRSFVGRWGLGDGGAKIRSGHILPSREPPSAVDVPAETSRAFDRLAMRFDELGIGRI